MYLYRVLPLFNDIRCIVFCKKIKNVRYMAGLWDFLCNLGVNLIWRDMMQ
jgi:hypothetical protein